MSEQVSSLFSDGALSMVEAARWAGLSRSKLFELVQEGVLPSVKVGKRRLIPKTALAEFLHRRMQEQGGEAIA